MPGLHTPTYPVVDPDPSIGKAIGNFNLTDYRNIIAFTGSGFITGFFIASKPLRYQNAKFLTTIGLVAGLTYATLSSSQRFMGLEPNDSEVRRYGSLSNEQVDEYNKISGSIGAELIGKHKLSK